MRNAMNAETAWHTLPKLYLVLSDADSGAALLVKAQPLPRAPVVQREAFLRSRVGYRDFHACQTYQAHWAG